MARPGKWSWTGCAPCSPDGTPPIGRPRHRPKTTSTPRPMKTCSSSSITALSDGNVRMANEEKLREYLKRAISEARRANEKLREAEEKQHEPLAVVGVACRFP